MVAFERQILTNCDVGPGLIRKGNAFIAAVLAWCRSSGIAVISQLEIHRKCAIGTHDLSQLPGTLASWLAINTEHCLNSNLDLAKVLQNVPPFASLTSMLPLLCS